MKLPSRMMAPSSARSRPPRGAARLAAARRRAGLLLLLVGPGLALGVHAVEPAFRYNAPITVQNPAAFVQLPLPASTYARSQQPGLADLRIVDAQGRRVPHALLPLSDEPVQREERLRPATLYALPARAAEGAALASPVDVLVQGDRITVRRKGGISAGAESPGWLIDLGERRHGEPAPEALRLAWSGTADFTAALDIDLSETLRTWRTAGSGQVLMLNTPVAARGSNTPQTTPGPPASPTPLMQRDLPLSADTPRFVRLVWRDAATAPRLTGVEALNTRISTSVQDPPTELRLPARAVDGGLQFDLGGALPIVALDLQLPPGTRVAPVQLQGRGRDSEAWRPLGSAVFYRIEREGATSRSPALPLQATVRQVRVLADDRAGALDPLQTQLVVHARLARIVFPAQGAAPYTLQAGLSDTSAGAPAGALPITTLVPQLETERPRLGRAELGPWTEVPAVAQAAAAAARWAALRPWLLWAVLLAGVSGLGWMVWRLVAGARGQGLDERADERA